MALYTEALGIDALADAVNAVLYCNRAASHMALGKHESAVSAWVKARNREINHELSSLAPNPKCVL